MTNEELIEAQAKWLHMRFATALDLPLFYNDRNEIYKQQWRDEALANFRMLNGCGVRMLDDGPGGLGLTIGFQDWYLVKPLPEAKEGK
jgi:hypothetical protein